MSRIVLALVASAAVVALAWLLGFRRTPRLADAAEAERVADEALTGFVARAVTLDREGRAALLDGNDGRTVLVRAAGDRWVVRIVAASAVERDPDRVTVREGSRAYALSLSA